MRGGSKLGKSKETIKVPIEVEFTDGYQERFTEAVLKIYAKRLQEPEEKSNGQDAGACGCFPQKVRVS